MTPRRRRSRPPTRRSACRAATRCSGLDVDQRQGADKRPSRSCGAAAGAHPARAPSSRAPPARDRPDALRDSLAGHTELIPYGAGYDFTTAAASSSSRRPTSRPFVRRPSATEDSRCWRYHLGGGRVTGGLGLARNRSVDERNRRLAVEAKGEGNEWASSSSTSARDLPARDDLHRRHGTIRADPRRPQDVTTRSSCREDDRPPAGPRLWTRRASSWAPSGVGIFFTPRDVALVTGSAGSACSREPRCPRRVSARSRSPSSPAAAPRRRP